MGIMDIFRRSKSANLPTETRSSGMGYTAAILSARASYISGASDLAELTATVQSCVSLWEGALSAADVEGTDLLDRRTMALVARSLALRGEAVFLIRDRLVPVADWDLSTINGEPRAYRVSVSEAGGGRSETALAAEVVHIRIGSDPVAPWHGSAPLKRAALSASLLQQIEHALRDTFRDAPIGSQVLPLPDSSPEDMQAMRGAFRGRHGSTLIVEGASQAAAAGMHVQQGQRREDLTPALERAQTVQTLEAARAAISQAFGVLPAMHHHQTTGPLIREAQRHLVQYTLSPIAKLMAEEVTAKLGGAVSIDVETPLQAYDTGGRARAMSAIIKAMAEAKEAGVDPEQAMKLVGWSE